MKLSIRLSHLVSGKTFRRATAGDRPSTSRSLAWIAVPILALLLAAQSPVAAADVSALATAIRDPSVLSQLVQADIRFRAQIHIRADQSWVESLYADLSKTVGHRALGALITPDEYGEVSLRWDLEDDMIEIDDALGATPYFGGTYLDHAIGGLITVLLTKKEAHASIPVTPHDDRVIVREVEYPLSKLETAFNAVRDRVLHSRARETGMLEAAISVSSNEVVVRYEAGSQGASAIAEGQLPAPFSIPFDTSTIRFEVLPATAPSEPRDLDCDTSVPPAWGGHGWHKVSDPCSASDPEESACSLGFEMDKAGVTDTDFMLTAGHCVQSLNIGTGHKVYHGNLELGTVNAWAIQTRDLASIRVPNQPRVTDDVEHDLNARDVTNVTSSYDEGELRCMTGISTWWTECGTIQYPLLLNVACQLTSIDGMVRVLIESIGGDSGGPLYRYIQSENVVRAAGITSCGGDNPVTHTDYQRIDYVPASWDLSISTS